jgi:hypothetical protein
MDAHVRCSPPMELLSRGGVCGSSSYRLHYAPPSREGESHDGNDDNDDDT